MKHKAISLILLIFLSAGFCFSQGVDNKKVAILETVDNVGNIKYGTKLMIRANLVAAITATPGYEGLDRVDVALVLKEHEFQRTGLVSDDAIRKLGEMTGATYILIAEAAIVDGASIFVTAHLVNVETGSFKDSANELMSPTSSGIQTGCKKLAEKLFNVNLSTGAVKGIITFKGLKYEGEHLNGKPHGKGRLYYASNDEHNRSYYEGDFINGKRDGKGILVWDNGARHEGSWKNGTSEGYGVKYYSDGNRYEGNWVNGKKVGHGVFIWKSGWRYEGNWVDDNRDGYGVEYHTNGYRYDGYFVKGKREGEGKLYYPKSNELNISYYEGDWVKGEKNGRGVMVWNDGDRYEGNWKNGRREGYGVQYYSNGDRYEGYWVNGKKEGQGKYIWANGNYDVGKCENGKYVGKWKKYNKYNKRIKD